MGAGGHPVRGDAGEGVAGVAGEQRALVAVEGEVVVPTCAHSSVRSAFAGSCKSMSPSWPPGALTQLVIFWSSPAIAVCTTSETGDPSSGSSPAVWSARQANFAHTGGGDALAIGAVDRAVAVVVDAVVADLAELLARAPESVRFTVPSLPAWKAWTMRLYVPGLQPRHREAAPERQHRRIGAGELVVVAGVERPGAACVSSSTCEPVSRAVEARAPSAG